MRIMKNIFILLLTTLIISACSVQPPAQTPAITKQAVSLPTLVRGDLTWEQSILVSQLSKATSVSINEIMVVSTEAVTWSDQCLGIVQKDANCKAGEVPGFRFVLIAGNKQYEYHTTKDMGVIFLVESK